MAACAAAAEPVLSDAKFAAQAGLVDITTLAPEIALDLRYASSNNFVGQRIDGYHAARCFLLQPAAEALQRVEKRLSRDGFRLRLFDCYRPARAVRHFVEWAGDLNDQVGKLHYYPNLEKSALLGDYIAPVSGHSRGATVDLTLMDCRGKSAHCVPLDMGTDFDFFDPRAHTDAPDIRGIPHENRHRLLDAMALEGFRNYALEWWHYSLDMEPAPETLFDVPIQ
ncbi:MAG: M15 family metallopeptidase [Tahibacter sp.]